MSEQFEFSGPIAATEQYPQPTSAEVFAGIREDLMPFSTRAQVMALVKGYLLQEKYRASSEQLETMVDSMMLRVGGKEEHTGRGGGT